MMSLQVNKPLRICIKSLLRCLLFWLSWQTVVYSQGRGENSKKIQVGIIEFSPLASVDKGEAKGPLIEYARSIFESAGLQPRFILVSINRSLEELKANNLDMVLTLFKNKERERFVQYSEVPFLQVTMGVCSLRELNKPWFSEKIRMAHMQGTIVDPSLKDVQHFPINGNSAQLRMLQMLLTHRVDLIYSPKPEVLLLVARQEKISKPIHCYHIKGDPWPIYFGYSQKLNRDILQKLESSLKRQVKSEDFDAFFIKKLKQFGISNFEFQTLQTDFGVDP